MVKREFFMTREDGVDLYRSYSDEGFMLLQVETGIMYSEAIDPADVERAYEETDIPIEEEIEEEQEIDK